MTRRIIRTSSCTSDGPFAYANQFFNDLLKELSEAGEAHRDELAAEGVELPRPGDPWVPTHIRFERYVSATAGSFPDSVGSYVIVLDPKRIDGPSAFAGAMHYLAEQTKSERVKYLVLEDRNRPVLDEVIQRSERASDQDFHLSPDRIEAQVNRDLESGRLSPRDRCQYLAMAGAFAFARGETAKAVQLQAEALKLAEQVGDPSDQANVLYNLGNAHLKNKELPAAEDSFVRAAQICLAHQLNPLLAMVMSNLGVTLHRAGRVDEALASLDVARSHVQGAEQPARRGPRAG